MLAASSFELTTGINTFMSSQVTSLQQPMIVKEKMQSLLHALTKLKNDSL